MHKCNNDQPCKHREGNGCNFDGECWGKWVTTMCHECNGDTCLQGECDCGKQLTQEQITTLTEKNLYGRWKNDLTQDDIEVDTTGGRWK